MQSGNTKFIRVKGRVIPIKEDQLGGVKGRYRKTATDNISKKEAVTSLRRTARSASKTQKKYQAAYTFSSAASLAFLGAALLARKNAGLARKLALGGLATVGTGVASGIASESAGAYASQARKDASRINKEKPLSGELRGARAKARAYASQLEQGIYRAAPVAIPINPIKPGDTSI